MAADTCRCGSNIGYYEGAPFPGTCQSKVIATLGKGEYSKQDWDSARNQEYGAFAPGRFVCPHGACFDHEGNIFVVEWVDAGRVTKLRRIV